MQRPFLRLTTSRKKSTCGLLCTKKRTGCLSMTTWKRHKGEHFSGDLQKALCHSWQFHQAQRPARRYSICQHKHRGHGNAGSREALGARHALSGKQDRCQPAGQTSEVTLPLKRRPREPFPCEPGNKSNNTSTLHISPCCLNTPD